MDNNKILIVEDDPNLGKVLLDYLLMKGFETDIAENGEIGLSKFLNQSYDFVVLDIMMPKKDGFSLAQDIRKINEKIPIIFLTAKSQKENILKAFKIGADDYLTKPFSIDELLVRIKAIQKRLPKKEIVKLKDEFSFGNFIFFNKQNLLIKDNNKINLTTKENELLKLFCLNINKRVDRNHALIKIWGDDSYYNARSMDVYIAKLRKYLSGHDNIKIQTIHGHGFKLMVLD
jgi:two-component system, OmpR family, response regulator VicR|tara:strand:+ start:1659 stop:2351 length:693 start_codon:yes stop_codon:yes gene_type:complete